MQAVPLNIHLRTTGFLELHYSLTLQLNTSLISSSSVGTGVLISDTGCCSVWLE